MPDETTPAAGPTPESAAPDPQKVTDIEALTDVAQTAVTLANDTQSAFATKGATAAQLLEIIPSIIKVASQGKEIPKEAKHLSEADLNQLVDVVGKGVSVPEGKATEIAAAVVPVAHAAVSLFERIVALSKAIAEHKGHG